MDRLYFVEVRIIESDDLLYLVANDLMVCDMLFIAGKCSKRLLLHCYNSIDARSASKNHFHC